MDLYQVGRYQNIAERIKRLSSPSNIATNEAQKGREKRFVPHISDIAKRKKYIQDNIFSKYSTMDTSRGAQERSSYSPIKNLYSPRNIKPIQTIETKVAYQPTALNKLQVEKSQKDLGRYVYEEQKGKLQNTNKLAKVRSDGNIKIQEILQSFNNYKQNKQRFLSNLGKQITSIHADHIAEEQSFFDDKQKEKERSTQEKQLLFLEIDNIWNEEEPSIPKFQRSYNPNDHSVDYITDVFSPIIAEPTQRPKNISKSKITLKNLNKDVETQDSQNSTLKTILSPRGPRIPGKICRNNDRTFTNCAR